MSEYFEGVYGRSIGYELMCQAQADRACALLGLPRIKLVFHDPNGMKNSYLDSHNMIINIDLDHILSKYSGVYFYYNYLNINEIDKVTQVIWAVFHEIGHYIQVFRHPKWFQRYHASYDHSPEHKLEVNANKFAVALLNRLVPNHGVRFVKSI